MLCTIPYQLLLRLWKAVRRRRLITLHIFHQFAPLLRSEPKEIWDSCYKQTLQTPSSVLSIYIKPLHSDTFASIACLSITTTFPLAELVKLTSLRNLGVLAISNPKAADDDSTIGDRLVRAWHLAARDSAAFPVLRVLRIRHTAHLTPSSLDFINSFPALALYDVTGCPGFRHPRPEHARSLGWSLQVNQEVSDMFAIPEPPSSVDDSCRQKSIVDEYLLIGRSRREDDLARVGIDITDRIPIHDVFTTPRPLVRIQLGDPKDATLGASWQRYHGLSDIVCFTRVHASRSRASAHATSKAGTLGSRTLKRTSSSTAGVRLSKQVKLESIMGLVG